MSNDDQEKRRYSEDEFAIILRKASEIQLSGEGSSKPSSPAGMTEIRSLLVVDIQ